MYLQIWSFVSEQQFTLLSFTTSLSPASPLPRLPLPLNFLVLLCLVSSVSFLSSSLIYNPLHCFLPCLLLSWPLSFSSLPLSVVLSFPTTPFSFHISSFPSLHPPFLYNPPFPYILLYSFSYFLLSPLTLYMSSFLVSFFPQLLSYSSSPSSPSQGCPFLPYSTSSFPSLSPVFLYLPPFRCFLLVFQFFLVSWIYPSQSFLSFFFASFLPWLSTAVLSFPTS